MSARCKSPKRREILRYALAGGVVAMAGTGLASRAFLPEIRRILGDSAEDTSALRSLAQAVVFGPRAVPVSIDRWSNARLSHRIRANILADYRQGRIVAVASWRISATEADALELMRRLQLI
ncbi:MAG TPA: hypothetical protein VG994_11810 [Steroidobacteraceae bacterium]|jgi:hypothetical protein|nr:hypothetical protein [Steroidobacteraceae bacterium]HVY81660.1 hypothetical protein [Steroidobacteraceae bacterium]